MPKLIALTTIDHDGKPYAEGDALDVADERQAQALVDAGAAELHTPARKPREKKPEPTKEEAEAAARAAAEAAALVDAEAAAAAAQAAADKAPE